MFEAMGTHAEYRRGKMECVPSKCSANGCGRGVDDDIGEGYECVDLKHEFES